ncbi:MAG TPA: LysR family transcriptional regulator [Burkholderiales bacterium]|nr:LysR family transcriptional regulator [Burkholderiales bacterium]
MSSFDLRRVRYFVAVAELGSVTRAAAELHVAQPALSHQIRLLEEEVGSELFTRGPQGVRLTELGRTLAEEGRALLANARRLRERLESGRGEPQGNVVIGLSQTIGPALALPLLELAAKRYPRVRVRVREVMSGDIPDLLRAEALDFAFSYAIQAGRGIRTTNVFSEDLFVVGTAQRAKKHFGKPDLREITFGDLARVPLYLSARSNSFREELERIARTRRVKLDVAAEVDSVSIRKEIALGGAGFTILSGASIRREIEAGGIFAARIAQPHLRRRICFARVSVSALSHAAEAVASLVPESLTTLVENDMWPGAMLPVNGIPSLT